MKSEVDALIAKDSELHWSSTDHIDVAVQDKAVRITNRYPSIEWKSVSTFWWNGHEIVCKNPNEADQAKMIRMARVLNATVMGDDGERYDLKKSFFGGEKIVMIPWPD